MKKIYKILLISVIALLVFYFLLRISIFKEIFYLVFMSFIISYTLKPLHKALVEKGLNNRLSALLIILFLIIIVLGTFTYLVPSLFRESLNIGGTISKIHEYINGLYSSLKPAGGNKTLYAILDSIYTRVNGIIINMFNRIFEGALNLGGQLLSLTVIPIIVYYFLADSDPLFNKVLMIIPLRSRNMVKKITKDLDKILSKYIISQLVLCALVGILTFIVLLILHVDFPIILSLLNAAFNIIPYFGPLFGAIPAIIMALLESPKMALYTAIWLYVIQLIEGNILSPKITGESVDMHPLLVIILLIVGGKLGGFLGMVLAVPIGVVIKVVYEDLNYYLF